MKKNISAFIGILFILMSCNCTNNKACDIDAEKKKIKAVLEQNVIAHENQDFKLIAKTWAESEDIILIGTDSDELLKGWSKIEKSIKNQFSQFQETYISVTDQQIKVNNTGNTAWFTEVRNYNFLYKGEAKSFQGVRFTGVLEKINDNWVMVQGHISVPAEVEMNEVY